MKKVYTISVHTRSKAMEMKYIVKCPWCEKSEVRSDAKANIHNTYICFKCRNAFEVDWKTLVAIRIKKSKGK